MFLIIFFIINTMHVILSSILLILLIAIDIFFIIYWRMKSVYKFIQNSVAKEHQFYIQFKEKIVANYEQLHNMSITNPDYNILEKQLSEYQLIYEEKIKSLDWEKNKLDNWIEKHLNNHKRCLKCYKKTIGYRNNIYKIFKSLSILTKEIDLFINKYTSKALNIFKKIQTLRTAHQNVMLEIQNNKYYDYISQFNDFLQQEFKNIVETYAYFDSHDFIKANDKITSEKMNLLNKKIIELTYFFNEYYLIWNYVNKQIDIDIKEIQDNKSFSILKKTKEQILNYHKEIKNKLQSLNLVNSWTELEFKFNNIDLIIQEFKETISLYSTIDQQLEKLSYLNEKYLNKILEIESFELNIYKKEISLIKQKILKNRDILENINTKDDIEVFIKKQIFINKNIRNLLLKISNKKNDNKKDLEISLHDEIIQMKEILLILVTAIQELKVDINTALQIEIDNFLKRISKDNESLQESNEYDSILDEFALIKEKLLLIFEQSKIIAIVIQKLSPLVSQNHEAKLLYNDLIENYKNSNINKCIDEINKFINKNIN